jgi:hypothetical protein
MTTILIDRRASYALGQRRILRLSPTVVIDGGASCPLRKREPEELFNEMYSENQDKRHFCGRPIRSTSCSSFPNSPGSNAVDYLQGRYVAVTPRGPATSAGRH